jgi:nucleoside-diphosphate-sugar epimerase
MKRVLVTGASGFIGRACVPGLLDRGYEVHAVSSRGGGAPLSGVHWHRVDLLDSRQLTSVLQEVAPTHLLHLAWVATPGIYTTSPTNLEWLRSGLELFRVFSELGGRRIVGAGSCLEYRLDHGYLRELGTPLEPTTLYGACKHALQLTLANWSKEVAVTAAWGRVFFLYGPREHPARLVSSVIRSLLHGKDALCSPGTQIMDFLHVNDVGEAFACLLDSEISGPVNIASGQPVAVKDVVNLIAQQLGRTDLVRLGAIPRREGEPPVLLADVTRLTSEAGFSPTFDLERGIAHTIDWWRSESGPAADAEVFGANP